MTIKTALTSQLTNATNTEITLATLNIAANTLAVGSVLQFEAWGVLTSPASFSTHTSRVRSSPTPVVIGSYAFANSATARTDVPVYVQATITIRTIGVSGTAIGRVLETRDVLNNTPTTVTTTTQTIDTTVAREFTITSQTNLTTASHRWVMATAQLIP